MSFPSRIILETIIIPKLDKGNVCFVGMSEQTQDYPELFSKANLLVIDQNPEKEKIAPNVQFEHVKLQDLWMSWEGHFDAIIASGIAGNANEYGTDSKEEITKCFEGAYKSMKSGGIFVWGWNDCYQLRIIDPVFITHKFRKINFGPLGSWRFPSMLSYDEKKEYWWTWDQMRAMNHTYDFYIKD